MGIPVTIYPTIVDRKSEYRKYKGCLSTDGRERLTGRTKPGSYRTRLKSEHSRQ